MQTEPHHSYSTLVNDAKHRHTSNLRENRSLFFSLPWFQKGDLDAWVAVASNNMATMLICLQILLSVGFPDEIVYGKIAPGVGISMAFGSIFYMIQAMIVARNSGRIDICSQPFGINTPGAFAFINSIILPVFFKKLQYDDEGNPLNTAEAAKFAWKVGVAANFIQGIVEIAFAIIGPQIQTGIPLVALLTSLASIGFSFLLSGPMLEEAAKPPLAFICIVIVFLGYFAGVKWFGIPTSLLSMIVGTSIGWAGGYLTKENLNDQLKNVKMYSGDFAIVEIFSHINEVTPYIGLIIPVGLTVAVGTIQCVELAKTAGDKFDVRWSMLGDGLATVIAACFGSVFGMTVFIGHPAFKAMGARVTYNALTALTFVIVCFTGLTAVVLGIVSIESLNPILIFVGIIVCVDTLNITPKRHFAAFILGMVPAVCNWTQEQAQALLQAAAPDVAQKIDFQDPNQWRVWGKSMHGLFLMGSNYLVTSIVLCCMMIFIIDRNFPYAMFWAFVGAVCSLFGFMHTIKLDVWVGTHDYGWRFCVAYTSIAALFGILYVLQRYGYVQETHIDESEKEKKGIGELEKVEGTLPIVHEEKDY
mmetsp:Transcript_16279/g.24538  ORF Transcript_16279/g.24538 Transcript_16279/m.24538 type:complete len:587 (+) Transcript_16279:54-1814(+)